MKQTPVLLAALVLVVAGAYGLWAPEAQADCNRSQCKLGRVCFGCEHLIILDIDCEDPLRSFCVQGHCEDVTSAEGEVAEAARAPTCGDTDEPEYPAVQVVSAEWPGNRRS